jgi:hypothetical protein
MPHQCTGCGHTFEDGSKEMLSGCPECGGNKFQFRPASESTDSSIGGDGTPTGGTDTATDASEPPKGDTDPATEPPDRPDRAGSSVAETVGRATTKVRDFVSSDPTTPEPDAEWPDDWESGASVSDGAPSGSDVAASGSENDDIIDADARRVASRDSDERKENAAQASARTDVVSSDELDDTAPGELDDTAPGELDDTAIDDESENAAVVDDEPDTPSGRSHGSGASEPSRTDPVSDGEIVSEPTDEDPDLAELREQLNDQFESIKILEPGQYELNLMELYDREEYIIALQENGRYVIQVPDQWIGEDLDDR